MTAIRSVSAAEGKFVQISNAAMQDPRLSLKARGLLAFVLSLPPGKTYTAKWIGTQAKEGREAIRGALRELMDCGYMRRTRKQDAHGHWHWEQVISDAVLIGGESADDDADTEPGQPSDGIPYFGNPPAGNPSLKELKTDTPNTEKMVRGQASRRAHASGKRAQRTVDSVVADIREAVAQVHGDDEAAELSEGELLGMYYTYANPGKKPVRELVPYMVKILSDAPYLDTFMANVEAICRECWRWESGCACGCPAESAA